MKRKFLNAGVAIGLFLGGALVTYALTQYFTTGEFKITPTPDHYFEIVVSGGEQPGSIGPGKSFSTQPTIENYATEEMYVFMKVEMPTVSGEALYSFSIGAGWLEIEDGVYAYAGDEMTVLPPGETTPALTSEMKMREISRAEFAQLTDVSVKITGYAIGTEEVPVVPSEAWEVCKMIGQIG